MRALPWHTPARWRAAAGLLALGGALAVALLAAQHEADPAPPGGQPGQHATPALGPPAPTAAAALQGLRSLAAPGANPQGPARTASAVEAALYGQGSLRESTPDGGWQVDSAGQLRPDLAVRRRFDHLLSALGEATPEELGALLQHQANRDLPPAAVAQVMALWQRYLALQQTRYTHQADLHQPASWQPALDERVRMRREWLGPAWADAFYLAEETALRSHIAARDGRAAMASTSAAPDDANPPTARLPDAARRPAPGDDLAALHQQRITEFGLEAAQRLQEEDAEQARWEQRIAEARQQITRLRQAPELSPVQREAAVAQALDGLFQGNERLRARALLGS